jgi:hypothetical protein
MEPEIVEEPEDLRRRLDDQRAFVQIEPRGE